MKEDYNPLEIEILRFESNDVITTSDQRDPYEGGGYVIP